MDVMLMTIMLLISVVVALSYNVSWRVVLAC